MLWSFVKWSLFRLVYVRVLPFVIIVYERHVLQWLVCDLLDRCCHSVLYLSPRTCHCLTWVIWYPVMKLLVYFTFLSQYLILDTCPILTCLLITWPPFLTYLLYNSILIQTDHSLTSISSSNLSTLTCPIIYLSTLYLSIPVETAHCCQSNYHLSVGTVLYCTCPL